MTTFAPELLKDIPYLNHDVLAGRFLSSLTFYDAGWHMWLPAGEPGDMRLFKMQGQPAEACYFAREPEGEQDLYLHFLDFVARYACYREIQKPVEGIHDDIFNLSTSLAKLALLEGAKDRVPHGLSRMATTEVEYVGLLCRSLFDLLQEIVLKLWDRIALLDETVRKRPLKSSFARTMLDGDKPLDAAAIAARFGMPVELAACYERAGDIFLALRRFRDNVVHHGSRVQHIFEGDGRFLIAKGLLPFPDLLLWDEDERQPNDLVPLMPAVETLIFRTLVVFDDFSNVLARVIRFPTPVVPDMHLFLRGYFTDVLRAALESGDRRTAAAMSAQGRDPAL